MSAQPHFVRTPVSSERAMEVVKGMFGVWSLVAKGWSLPDVKGATLKAHKSTYNTRDRASGMFYGSLANMALSVLLHASMQTRAQIMMQKKRIVEAHAVDVWVEITIPYASSNALIRIDSSARYRCHTLEALKLRGADQPYEGVRHWAVDDLINRIVHADYGPANQ